MRVWEAGIDLSRAEILALLAHADDADSRVYLYALHFYCGPYVTRVSAANGHVAACVETNARSGSELEWLVPRPEVEKAARMAVGKGVATFGRPIDDGGSRGIIQVASAVLPYKTVDANFPDHNLLFPPRTRDQLGAASRFDGEFLSGVALVAKAANEQQAKKRDRKLFGMTVFPALDPKDPILFRCHTDSDRWQVSVLPIVKPEDFGAVERRLSAGRAL